jgi:hypothetical protein
MSRPLPTVDVFMAVSPALRYGLKLSARARRNGLRDQGLRDV